MMIPTIEFVKGIPEYLENDSFLDVFLKVFFLVCDEYIFDFNVAEDCYCSSLLFLFKTIPTMELIRARRVTVPICIPYKPENSVILLSANLGLERRWIRRKTKDCLSHRALRRQIFQQISKVMSCNGHYCKCVNSLSTSKGGVSILFFF